MRRLVDDDVRTRLRQDGRSGGWRSDRPPDSVDELTSRMGSSDIPEMLDRLEAAFDPAAEGASARRLRKRRTASDTPRAARRAAGDEHDLGRRGRAAAGPDGRRRPAQDDRRVHPGHQPGRPQVPRPGLSPSTTGPGPVTCPTTRPSSTTTPRSTSTSRRCRSRRSAAGALDRGLTALLVSLVRLQGTEFNANETADAGSTTRTTPTCRRRSRRSCGGPSWSSGQRDRLIRSEAELQRRLDQWRPRPSDRPAAVGFGYDGKNGTA